MHRPGYDVKLPSPIQFKTMAAVTDSLQLFDRINLAACAAKRAQINVSNVDRFTDEYMSARLWTKYKCSISTTISFVEAD
jgi:hypothetical protein